MESEGGGVATAITAARLSSQHSTLRETFLASDLAELNNTCIINSNSYYNINHTTNNENNENNTNGLSNQRPVSTLTLGAVLNCNKKSPPPSNIVVRTLLEIIRNDETLNSGSSPSSQLAGRKPWKSFKERLKLRRASILHSSNSNQNQNPNSQCSISAATAVAAISGASNYFRDIVSYDDLALREVDSGGSPRSGGSFRLSAALAAERGETRRRLSRELIEVNRVEEEEVAPSRELNEEGEENNNSGSQENQPVRMSLMDLLEETDRQAGASGLLYTLDDNGDDAEVAEEDKEKAKVEDEVEEYNDGKVEHSCCVCMVRHKGAAFIPCGHTFCRLCSRELWVQRGNCPLCNNFILEVLDIF